MTMAGGDSSVQPRTNSLNNFVDVLCWGSRSYNSVRDRLGGTGSALLSSASILMSTATASLMNWGKSLGEVETGKLRRWFSWVRHWSGVLHTLCLVTMHSLAQFLLLYVPCTRTPVYLPVPSHL